MEAVAASLREAWEVPAQWRMPVSRASPQFDIEGDQHFSSLV
jgi:hypothetical protein